jgi:magnesium chelatase subunit I
VRPAHEDRDQIRPLTGQWPQRHLGGPFGGAGKVFIDREAVAESRHVSQSAPITGLQGSAFQTYGEQVTSTSAAADRPGTIGALRVSGHVAKTIKAELRDNLLARMRSGEDRFPGIIGFDDTVLPQVERAILAGHDIVLLGERGQGKTRLIRTLVQLLDEWTPVVAGCEINDHPFFPVCVACRRLVAEKGDDVAITWKPRDERYAEKLATPDVSVGDLIGDVDPIKVAEGRRLGDPETVHYGLVPRTNRGIVAINELPDLAERIQVALLNVLEERDIQVRGYTLRLPLDVLLLATANPEDYTNRGRIITPLKDRFGAEVRTHYPLELDDELRVVAQEALIVWGNDAVSAALPDHLVEIIARFTRHVRESPAVDHRSGVSARFAVSAAETVAASAVRRAALTSEDSAVARVADLPAIVPAVQGKVEFETSEEGREADVLEHLLRRSVADTFRSRLGGVDLTPLVEMFNEGASVETGELVPGTELLSNLGTVPGLGKLLTALDIDEGAENPGLAAAGLEFALEGLYLLRRLSKETLPDRIVYGAR